MMEITTLYTKALQLLKNLIGIPAFSGEEDQTAQIIQQFLESNGCATERIHNNIWSKNLHFDPEKPTILLNSHHDTVRPNKAYTRNPFSADIAEGKLYGLGSNDAGASLVGLISAFLYFHANAHLSFNLVLALTGEEENSGPKGISSILQHLPAIDAAIVGEPTEMHLAVSEKGLLVIDAHATGIAGHAAHTGSKSAIYEAVQDIQAISAFEFPKVSPTLGQVKVTATQIQAGIQHNVTPESCHFVLDVRVNDCYTNREVFAVLDGLTRSKLTARSFRLNSSSIPETHPIVLAGKQLNRKCYGSPTLSDQALLPFPSVKIGPGVSERSHTADEFIELKELQEGIEIYIQLLENTHYETLGQRIYGQ